MTQSSAITTQNGSKFCEQIVLIDMQLAMQNFDHQGNTLGLRAHLQISQFCGQNFFMVCFIINALFIPEV